RRNRRHHHDHGAGDEGAAWREHRCPCAVDAGVPELCSEFCVPGHLLEQPPPYAACLTAGDRRHAVGEPAPPVLAIAHPLYYRVDGRESLCSSAIGSIRRSPVHGGYRLLDTPAADHRITG